MRFGCSPWESLVDAGTRSERCVTESPRFIKPPIIPVAVPPSSSQLRRSPWIWAAGGLVLFVFLSRR